MGINWLWVENCPGLTVEAASKLRGLYIYMLNKNTYDVKSAGPIRSNIANRQARPKAEAKKLLYQIFVTP